jgi:hypothetical protein
MGDTMEEKNKKIAMLMVVGFLAVSVIGCVEIDIKVYVYPDGSGKAVEKVVLGEQATAMIDMMVEQAGKKPEEALKEGMKQGNKGDSVKYDFVSSEKIEKKDGKYVMERVGYFKDINKAMKNTTFEKQKNGTFILSGKGDKSEEKDIEQFKKMRAFVKGLRISLIMVCPGEITKADGYDSHKGREAKLTIDLDKLQDMMEKGEKFEMKIICDAPTKGVETEFEEFKKEYAEAEKKAKEKKEEDDKEK